MSNYNVIQHNSKIIKAWTKGVLVEQQAEQQLRKLSELPFIHKWISVMPDVHLGKGATVGSVIPTKAAICPASVGVDLSCGVMAVKTTLKASDLPDSLSELRSALEAKIPVGQSFYSTLDAHSCQSWAKLNETYKDMIDKHPYVEHKNVAAQLGTLGGGNHFIELCLDENQDVWIMLHSGSRGVGNRIGTYFIEKAKMDMKKYFIHLPDQDLAYLAEGSEYFDDYVTALDWASKYAMANRELMMKNVISVLTKFKGLPNFSLDKMAVNCHHNYVRKENHYGENVYITRKGALSARDGELGIIPGSMGAKSYIVRGKGNPESFHSCSHGAGRVMSRGEAKKVITMEDHAKAVAGVECRMDQSVLDESPAAYKDIDLVMAAQSDLVDIVHTLKQQLCIKG